MSFADEPSKLNRLEQLENAFSPILVTPLVLVKLVKDVSPLKQSFGTLVTFVKSNEGKLVHP